MSDIYKTTDQAFAAYLRMHGGYCIRAVPAGDPTFPNKKAFVFTDIDDPKTLEDHFFRGKRESMSALDYSKHMRTMNRIVKEGLSEEDMEKLRG